MANMSYCRFQNTARDLDDCQQALEDFLAGAAENGTGLSREELQAARRLIRTAIDIAQIIGEELHTDDIEAISDKQIAKLLENTQAESYDGDFA